MAIEQRDGRIENFDDKSAVRCEMTFDRSETRNDFRVCFQMLKRIAGDENQFEFLIEIKIAHIRAVKIGFDIAPFGFFPRDIESFVKFFRSRDVEIIFAQSNEIIARSACKF